MGLHTSDSIGGRIIVVVFLIIWIAIATTMGFSFIDFANDWPDWGPGPHPSLFTWIPFAMAGFGIILLLLTIIGWVRKPGKTDSSQGYTAGAIPYDDIPSSSTQASGYREPSVSYQIQPFCGHCGARIDSELVEWVGPLKYKCPACGYTHKAETKYQ
jgi:hypothetical protein